MFSTANHWSYLQLFQFFAPRVLFAILCGGLIGLERELKNKPAGIKTNILICVGSAIYTSASILISASLSDTGHWGDPARVSAQIVSGIGFLGGGTIIQARGTILGLTTAATIWVVAAIGICIGVGYWDMGVLVSLTVVAVLVGTNLFEDKVLGRSLTFACEVSIDDPKGEVRMAIHQALSRNDLILDDFDLSTSGQRSALTFKYNGHRDDHKKFILELWNIPGIREVKQV